MKKHIVIFITIFIAAAFVNEEVLDGFDKIDDSGSVVNNEDAAGTNDKITIKVEKLKNKKISYLYFKSLFIAHCA